MGKKNIIITENQMSRLTQMIMEDKKRFENQEMIDAILDKINEFGMDSLTDEEKQILNNPDKKIETNNEPSDDAEDIIYSNEAMSRLISSGFLDYKDIMILDETSFQVSDIIDEDGYGFEYFSEGNKIRLTTNKEQDEILVEGMDEDYLGDSIMKVMEYIKQNWEPNIGLTVHVEGIDF